MIRARGWAAPRAGIERKHDGGLLTEDTANRGAPSADKSVLVEFDAVNKSYDGQTPVVQDLNLVVADGEFLTLLGPSGSGKTTSLMMLAGFEMPSSGQIRLNGQPIQNLAPHRRNIGVVFQNYALFPHMTVAENLAYPLKVRRLPKHEIKASVTRALDMVQMSAFAERRPVQLSGGQQQRVALARALVFEPALVLMDEPLGALDKNLREHMQLEIKRIHSNLGFAVMYVTHDQSEALTMSDRIAIFNNGRIEQIAPPECLYEQPQSAFVASFIGDNNAIRGSVSDVDGTECTVTTSDGALIRSRYAGNISRGDTVVVSVRPERLSLSGPEQQADNSLPAVISEVIYLGDHIRVHAETQSRQIMKIKLQNLSVRPSLTSGESTHVSWSARDGVVLKI
ncbi:MAG: ABC transporter ATP-binding protein [Mesorhizobium sp.]|nr:MAG: ABC transporter ATP-binding protein [Mesorhizobium sp.]RWM58186.1 MAG: ABC transporter ATP-binding protein [Mesorhizobium sp.]RWM58649.1 MAG: ABC transporter ATP-binding protein [Mesorhizobium sp.]TIO70052.1 MAG: ABC transporter ATP-binding protein [Mesorhizobium sp.]TJV93941.1 MAG: ABC transporter ATP-binding protein [Mesorhizobium sp.]